MSLSNFHSVSCIPLGRSTGIPCHAHAVEEEESALNHWGESASISIHIRTYIYASVLNIIGIPNAEHIFTIISDALYSATENIESPIN